MARLGTPQWKQFSGYTEIIGGQDDNFDEWSSALIWFTTFNANWRPTERLRFDGRLIDQRFYRRSDRQEFMYLEGSSVRPWRRAKLRM